MPRPAAIGAVSPCPEQTPEGLEHLGCHVLRAALFEEIEVLLMP
jgi:hypothetical protein